MIFKLLFLITFCTTALFSEQTIGLFKNSQQALDGYTLFAPLNFKNTYLIDNCGELIHRWQSKNSGGLSNYLLENGNLLQTKKLNNSVFNTGGSGGGIEILDWDSNLLWEYDISSELECQHHDIEILPNGNILINAWEFKTKEEATANGREIIGNALWSEKIIEVKPDYVNGGGEIVWQWSVWDHLVQDFDKNKVNYGDVSLSPQLVNINFYEGNANNADWLHINAVDYNAELDQIVLSCHGLSEIWIIDHSTTAEEAKSHSGGKSGKGGDLVYRWGNPQAYNQGSPEDQILFKQHDPNWIEKGFVDEGKIMIFNNQAGSPDKYSDVIIINPPIDENGNYIYQSGAFLPNETHWKYEAENPTDFFATNISGARRLSNGNTLICSGPSGKLFEVDYMGEKVWEYVNPVTQSGVINQGAIVSQNSVFRATRFTRDYPAFDGKTLVQKGYIEYGSEYECELFMTSVEDKFRVNNNVYPNPSNSVINIKSDEMILSIKLYNSIGELINSKNINNLEYILDISNLSTGIYFIELNYSNGNSEWEKVIRN